jgi:tetratricopeptide (TPR) repeat protein
MSSQENWESLIKLCKDNYYIDISELNAIQSFIYSVVVLKKRYAINSENKYWKHLFLGIIYMSIMEYSIFGRKKDCNRIKPPFPNAAEYHLKIASENGNTEAMLELSEYYDRSGHEDKQYYWIDKAMQTGNKIAIQYMACYYKSIRLYHMHDKDECELKMVEYFEKSSNFCWSLYELGNHYIDINKEKAMKYWNDGIWKAFEQHEYVMIYKIAKIYKNLKEYWLMRRALRLIIDKYPKALINYGWYFLEIEKDYNMAKKYLYRFIKLNKNKSVRAHHLLGKCHQLTNNVNLMRKYYYKGRYIKCYLGLASYYEEERKIELAEKWYLKARETHNNDGNVVYKFMLFYYKIKEYKKAYELYTHSYHGTHMADIDTLRARAFNKLFDDKAEFVRLLKDAVEKDSFRAMNYLAKMSDSTDETIKYLKMALKLNNYDGIMKLRDPLSFILEHGTKKDVDIIKKKINRWLLRDSYCDIEIITSY